MQVRIFDIFHHIFNADAGYGPQASVKEPEVVPSEEHAVQEMECNWLRKDYPQAENCEHARAMEVEEKVRKYRKGEDMNFGGSGLFLGYDFENSPKIPSRRDAINLLFQQHVLLQREAQELRVESIALRRKLDRIDQRMSTAQKEKEKIEILLQNGFRGTSLASQWTEDRSILEEKLLRQEKILSDLALERRITDLQIKNNVDRRAISKGELRETRLDLRNGRGTDDGLTTRKRLGEPFYGF